MKDEDLCQELCGRRIIWSITSPDDDEFESRVCVFHVAGVINQEDGYATYVVAVVGEE